MSLLDRVNLTEAVVTSGQLPRKGAKLDDVNLDDANHGAWLLSLKFDDGSRVSAHVTAEAAQRGAQDGIQVTRGGRTVKVTPALFNQPQTSKSQHMSLFDRINHVAEAKCPPGTRMVFGKCRKGPSPQEVAKQLRAKAGDGPMNPAQMMRLGKKLRRKEEEASLREARVLRVGARVRFPNAKHTKFEYGTWEVSDFGGPGGNVTLHRVGKKGKTLSGRANLGGLPIADFKKLAVLAEDLTEAKDGFDARGWKASLDQASRALRNAARGDAADRNRDYARQQLTKVRNQIDAYLKKG